jgi:glycine/D-amino acid oxidase-like deaminating enzyme
VSLNYSALKECQFSCFRKRIGRIFYGIPDSGNGVKVARHHTGEFCDLENIKRAVTYDDEGDIRDFLRRRMPKLNGDILSSGVCLYTNSPDLHFIIDYHPQNKNVVIVSPYSCHGFKFSSVIGEIASQMLIDRKTEVDLSFFRLSRLKKIANPRNILK